MTYALREQVADPAARTWFESGLEDATKYTYRVRAYSDDAGSSYTTNKVSVVTTLPAPSDVGVSLIGGTSAFVSWTASPASTTTGYSIYKLSPGSSAQLVGQAAANATSFQVTGLTESTEYRLLVQANSSTGGQDSAFATSAIITTLPPGVPIAPTNLTATPTDVRVVSVTWADNSDDETGFTIERRGIGGTWEVVGSVGADVTGFTDNGVYSGTGYEYRASATGSGGASTTPETADAVTEYGDGIVYAGRPGATDEQLYDGVTANWSGPYDRTDPLLANDSLTLNLSNLPVHYGLEISARGGGSDANDTDDVDVLTLAALGESDTFVYTAPHDNMFDLGITANHTDNTATLTISGSGFEAGTESWGIGEVSVRLLRSTKRLEYGDGNPAGQTTLDRLPIPPSGNKSFQSIHVKESDGTDSTGDLVGEGRTPAGVVVPGISLNPVKQAGGGYKVDITVAAAVPAGKYNIKIWLRDDPAKFIFIYIEK